MHWRCVRLVHLIRQPARLAHALSTTCIVDPFKYTSGKIARQPAPGFAPWAVSLLKPILISALKSSAHWHRQAWYVSQCIAICQIETYKSQMLKCASVRMAATGFTPWAVSLLSPILIFALQSQCSVKLLKNTLLKDTLLKHTLLICSGFLVYMCSLCIFSKTTKSAACGRVFPNVSRPKQGWWPLAKTWSASFLRESRSQRYPHFWRKKLWRTDRLD